MERDRPSVAPPPPRSALRPGAQNCRPPAPGASRVSRSARRAAAGECPGRRGSWAGIGEGAGGLPGGGRAGACVCVSVCLGEGCSRLTQTRFLVSRRDAVACAWEVFFFSPGERRGNTMLSLFLSRLRSDRLPRPWAASPVPVLCPFSSAAEWRARVLELCEAPCSSPGEVRCRWRLVGGWVSPSS